jgi:hypothetical protein
MNVGYKLYVVAGVIALIAVLMLFPEWIGVHPNGGLVMPLGHAWIFSPPLPPEHSTGLRVERDWIENIWIAIGAIMVGTVLIVRSPRRAIEE